MSYVPVGTYKVSKYLLMYKVTQSSVTFRTVSGFIITLISRTVSTAKFG